MKKYIRAAIPVCNHYFKTQAIMAVQIEIRAARVTTERTTPSPHPAAVCAARWSSTVPMLMETA
jgi:hypothetical protein